ncbi:DUF7691 family protein [Streptomyces huiliensis]|uniref:DUF7691 family protein n=1 Tax=Streptomyces huiliensis TaxID=2876027 RepID=UPI001CC0EC7D|nr:hypothetical protein [Streptomyces huiliensis]MBZ4324046.1 hypothetical protein [Streptomyces huiliensis]
MSSAMSFMLLDLAATRAFIGGRDEKLSHAVRDNFGADLAASDSWFGSEIDRGAPTAYQALEAVINGGPFDEEFAFQYGYAYKRLCELTGYRLSNDNFCPIRVSWLPELDKAMAGLGITAVSVSELTWSLPAPLPFTDLPGYGEWTAEDCAKGLAQWEATTEEQRRAVDPMTLEVVEECVSWLWAARRKPGFGVVGFLS